MTKSTLLDAEESESGKKKVKISNIIEKDLQKKRVQVQIVEYVKLTNAEHMNTIIYPCRMLYGQRK